MTEQESIFRAIESFTGLQIVCFHDEATRYAFKIACDHGQLYRAGEWATLDKNIIDDVASNLRTGKCCMW